jgi:hypothetical protein
MVKRNTIGVFSSTTSTAYDNNNPSLMGNPKKDAHYYYNVDYKDEDDKSYHIAIAACPSA